MTLPLRTPLCYLVRITAWTRSRCYWFTSLDMLSGYHQVNVALEDRDKTAFVTHRLEACSISRPCPSARPMLSECYPCDDPAARWIELHSVSCLSRTHDEHLEWLELVLDQLVRANHKLKPSKCNIMQTTIQFLGHTISAYGVEPQQVKFD